MHFFFVSFHPHAGIYIADLFLSLLWAEAFMCFMAALVPHYIIGIAVSVHAW